MTDILVCLKVIAANTLQDNWISRPASSQIPVFYLGIQLIEELVQHLDNLFIFKPADSIFGKDHNIHFWQAC
jgi:hypothetical protein